MKVLCLFGLHDEACGLLNENGDWYWTNLFEIPMDGALEVYWKCRKCGRLRKSIWGVKPK